MASWGVDCAIMGNAAAAKPPSDALHCKTFKSPLPHYTSRASPQITPDTGHPHMHTAQHDLTPPSAPEASRPSPAALTLRSPPPTARKRPSLVTAAAYSALMTPVPLLRRCTQSAASGSSGSGWLAPGLRGRAAQQCPLAYIRALMRLGKHVHVRLHVCTRTCQAQLAVAHVHALLCAAKSHHAYPAQPREAYPRCPTSSAGPCASSPRPT